ncbi:hypothetical protein [Streptomyces sp. NBC_00286]|uniref:hypothetical protein n=1 Tax=Streptomyces sp. NBC_00286 TaxID=2975701 RepID=UPI002E2D3964|nr:hypothetical protein [Streptomyces sp. NBC_00286]
MTNTAPIRTTTALRHRKLAVDAFNEAQAHYEIAVLDHVAALVAEAYPETTHLTFDHSAHDRRIELHALWTTRHDGTEEQLLDVRQDGATAALDLDELADDLSDALAGLHSAAWSTVRPDPRPDRRWVLDLPPADRAERLAELVRAHHPKAGLVTVEFVGRGCRVLNVDRADVTKLSIDVIAGPRPASGEGSLFPQETERQISALVLQIHALPHLRAQHLVRVGGPATHTALLLLPQTNTHGE